MPTKANTCHTLITPNLQTAGRQNDYYDGGQVEIAADGKQLRVVKLTDYTAEKVADAGQRTFSLSASNGERAGVRCRSPKQAALFGYFAPEAREILNDLLEKYADDGELQSTLPDVLKVPPIPQHGNVAEITGKFGGADQLRNASPNNRTVEKPRNSATTRATVRPQSQCRATRKKHPRTFLHPRGCLLVSLIPLTSERR